MNSPSAPFRTAIIGTGYIADFHARSIANIDGVELVGVCDANTAAANEFAAHWGVPSFGSLLDMISATHPNALHVLTPPDTHHDIAKLAMESGVNVFLEKPMSISGKECASLLAIAEKSERTVAVNHSVLFEGAMTRLRQHIATGDLGPIDHITINYFLELPHIRFGPFTNWILREPKNSLLELGPHPIAALINLVGALNEIEVKADRDTIVPGGARVYRRWRIRTAAGRATADVNIDLGPGFQQRTIAVRGLAGTALADLDANTCVIDRKTPAAVDFDRRIRSKMQATQLRDQSNATLKQYILGKSKLSKRGAPFSNSILDSAAAFYEGLHGGAKLDTRISGEFGKMVIETCEEICRAADLKGSQRRPKAAAPKGVRPTVLVLGGTGFIGRRLIKVLLEKGYSVRAAARGSSLQLEELRSDRLEIVRVDMRSGEDVGRALDGIEHAFHLATTDAKTWQQFLDFEIEPTRHLARACLDLGVRRLIYTGTIDSYYAGGGAGTITEKTPLDPKIGRRNYYARAKAVAEAVLSEMYHKEGLPVVIARPGIVVGEGGNPFHWGVGMWSSHSVVQIWGEGTNPLPLVLVDDVAKGLVLAMETPDVEGRSYNLVDTPMLSARDYIAAIERLAGYRIDMIPTPIRKFFLRDLAKWPVKRLLGHPDGSRVPSYLDWESRTQKATFDSATTRDELGWSPISDPNQMVTAGIGGSLAAWLAARQ